MVHLREPATALSASHPGRQRRVCSYISRNNFDDMIGARSEQLAKEAFSRMDVQLDLNMTMIRPLVVMLGLTVP